MRPEPGAGPYRGARLTEQRKTIAEVAASMHGAFTVEELAGAVRAQGGARGSTATVYRSVAALADTGFLARVGHRDGATLYARCAAPAHHHHIVCDRCGTVAHTDCPLADVGSPVEGFVVTRHEVTLYGICPDCARGGD